MDRAPVISGHPSGTPQRAEEGAHNSDLPTRRNARRNNLGAGGNYLIRKVRTGIGAPVGPPLRKTLPRNRGLKTGLDRLKLKPGPEYNRGLSVAWGLRGLVVVPNRCRNTCRVLGWGRGNRG